MVHGRLVIVYRKPTLADRLVHNSGWTRSRTSVVYFFKLRVQNKKVALVTNVESEEEECDGGGERWPCKYEQHEIC